MTLRTTIGGKSPFPIIEDFRTDLRTEWKPAKPTVQSGAAKVPANTPNEAQNG